jgi:hypothetical protein
MSDRDQPAACPPEYKDGREICNDVGAALRDYQAMRADIVSLRAINEALAAKVVALDAELDALRKMVAMPRSTSTP